MPISTSRGRWRAGIAALLISGLGLGAAVAAGPQHDPLPAATEPVLSADGAARIDAFFAREIAAGRMPGAVLAIARDGKLGLYKAYGYLDKAAGTPMPRDAIFNLASMTKVMAVVGALTFYEEGRLRLNAPLADFYPAFAQMQVGVVDASGTLSTRPARRQITIQDLMRHTSGLTYGGRGATPIHRLYPPSSADAALSMDGPQFLTKLAGLPLRFEPATVWDYGFSTDVLGLVEEKLAGKPLRAILAERIWSRIGMPDTGFEVPEAKRARLAQPLPVDPMTGKPQVVRILSEKVKFDCAGSCGFATAADYLRFGQMLLNGGILDGARILSPHTVALMTSDHLGATIDNRLAQIEEGRAGYGFGLGVAVRKERGVAAINGSVGDFTWNGSNGTIFWADPQQKLVVVMMAVTPGEIRKVYREELAALVYGALR